MSETTNRVPMMVANWKMNLTASESAAFAERLLEDRP